MEFRPNVTGILPCLQSELQSLLQQPLRRRCNESSTSSLCSLRGPHLLDHDHHLCLCSIHFIIQTKQREQVQRDSVHLNNWTDSVALQDPLSHHSIVPPPWYFFFFFSVLLEVCPRKQPGTWASGAANPGAPTDSWKRMGKKEKGKGMSQSGNGIENPDLLWQQSSCGLKLGIKRVHQSHLCP